MDYKYEDTVIDKKRIIENSISFMIAFLATFIVIGCIYLVYNNTMDNSRYESDGSRVTNEDLSRIEEAINDILNTHIDMNEITLETLIEGAISGAAASTGDVYTRYLTEEAYNEMLTSGSSKYVGIGVNISYDAVTGGIGVIGVMENSPALSAGIEVGDIITNVGDITLSKETYSEAIDALKAEENSVVNVKVLKLNGEKKDYILTISAVDENNVSCKMIDEGVGYIRIFAFENSVSSQFKKAYDDLTSKGMKSLIIDLRNNGGGLLSEAVSIARMLMPQGEIVRLVYNDGTEKSYTCDGENAINIPLNVLVNSGSASASEILTGALKDSGIATIMGTKTYGKGIVQTITKLKNGLGAISITTAKYYTASGIEIHKNGIEPNITVEQPEEYKGRSYVPFESDTELKEAINNLKEKMQ